MYSFVLLFICASMILTTLFPQSNARDIVSSAIDKYSIEQSYNDDPSAPSSLSTIYTSCGGVIQVQNGEPAVLNYKLNQTYDVNEQCVWTIRNADRDYLNFRKTGSELEVGYDFIQISSVHLENSSQTSQNFILGNSTGIETVRLRAELVFVIFSSDEIISGKGFSLEISVDGKSSAKCNCNDVFSDSAYGIHTYNTSIKMLTFVIAPRSPGLTSLQIFLDINEFLDAILIFRVIRFGRVVHFRHLARISAKGYLHIDSPRRNATLILIGTSGSQSSLGTVNFNWITQ